MPALRITVLLASVVTLAMPLSAQVAQVDTTDILAKCNALKAEAHLEREIALVRKKHAADTAFLRQFALSQRAWERFYHAQIDAIFLPGQYYGTVQSPCECIDRTEMIDQRLAQLARWTERTEEGDVCAGTRQQAFDGRAVSEPQGRSAAMASTRVRSRRTSVKKSSGACAGIHDAGRGSSLAATVGVAENLR
jgi:hypothetical protein